jgi:hypothetical protein
MGANQVNVMIIVSDVDTGSKVQTFFRIFIRYFERDHQGKRHLGRSLDRIPGLGISVYVPENQYLERHSRGTSKYV